MIKKVIMEIEKKEIYNAQKMIKGSKKKMQSLNLRQQNPDQQLSKRDYQKTFQAKNDQVPRSEQKELDCEPRRHLRTSFWTVNGLGSWGRKRVPDSYKFFDFKLENKHRVNSQLDTKMKPKIKGLGPKKPRKDGVARIDSNLASPGSPVKSSQISTSFLLKKTKNLSSRNPFQVEFIMPPNVPNATPTRNDIYTRSYRIDEECEMFQKVLDLSQIYSDCPDMYQTRQDYVFWLVESIATYRMTKEHQVLSRTVQILDSLFCKCQMDKAQKEILTKIGVTAIWIAAKYEGVGLSLDRLMAMLDPRLKRKFQMSKRAILSCENLILRTTDFRISAPVHTDFVENFLFRIFYEKKPASRHGGFPYILQKSALPPDAPIKINCIAKGQYLSPNVYNSIDTDKPATKEQPEGDSQQKPKEGQKKRGSPISFEEFKKRIKSFKKKPKEQRQKDRHKRRTQPKQSQSSRPWLESLMREYTRYYLKLLYHTIESCLETHVGTLACLVLAYRQLARLPPEAFANIQTTFQMKCIFFIKLLNRDCDSVIKALETELTENPKTSNFDKEINEAEGNSQRTDTVCAVSDTQSTQIKCNGNDSSHKRSRQDSLRESLLVQRLPAQRGRDRGASSPDSKVNYDKDCVTERILLQNTQKMVDSEKLRFDVRSVQLFWNKQQSELKNSFKRAQSLEFLKLKLGQILKYYFYDDIEKISNRVFSLERNFLRQKSKFIFLQKNHPNPKYLLDSVHLF